MLKSANRGYTVKTNNIQETFDHLFYVDDLKLFAETKEYLEHNLKPTKTFQRHQHDIRLRQM